MALTYALEPAIARRRALAGALAGAIASIGPVLLGIVLLVRTGVEIDKRVFFGVIACICLLAGLRTLVSFSRMRAELNALRVSIDDAGIDVKTRRKTHRIPREAIETIVEFPGALGGLRLDLVERWDGSDRSPGYFDIPRGGDGFGDLRAALERWKAVETKPRRGRIARIVLGAFIILGLFFVPFMMADVGKTPLIAAAVVLAGFLAMRIAMGWR